MIRHCWSASAPIAIGCYTAEHSLVRGSGTHSSRNPWRRCLAMLFGFLRLFFDKLP